MSGTLVRRVVSVLLLALVAGGGGTLPTVDALIFHETLADSAALGSHFEAGSDCHDDGCSVRSVAHESRLTPLLGTPALRTTPPEAAILLPVPVFAARMLLASSHRCRAPPLPV